MGVIFPDSNLDAIALNREPIEREGWGYTVVRTIRSIFLSLVTTGPYAWIRHPIYLALMGFLAGLALITANWLMIAIFGFSIVDLVLRVPKEEQMMMEELGEEYKEYKQATGKLLPKHLDRVSSWRSK